MTKLYEFMYRKSCEVSIQEADMLYRKHGFNTIVNDGIAWASGLER